MSDKLVKYGSIEKVVKDAEVISPRPTYGESPGQSALRDVEYLKLLEQFKVVNFEYNRLSNYWMGFIAAHRPTQRELDLFEARGQMIFDLGNRALKLKGSTKWYHRLFMRIFWWLTGE